jgi:environmental stress-induced protein Ves
MTVLRYADMPEQPWRNGRGVTRELHSSDGWRLSVATIAEAGPFSVFPGLDRVFVVADGAVDLDLDGTARLLNTGQLERFPGEVPVHAGPQGGPVLAVNVMSTRATHIVEVSVARIDGPAPTADAIVLLAGTATSGTSVEPLLPLDAVVPADAVHCNDALAVFCRVRILGGSPAAG